MYENIRTEFDSIQEFVRHLKVELHEKSSFDWLRDDWSYAQYDHQFRKANIKGWQYVGMGSYRACYKRPDRKWVLKIPRIKKGIQDCTNEAAMFRARGGKYNPNAKTPENQGALAPCRLVKIEDVPCLVMPELVMPVSYKDHPSWVNTLRDGRQIGRTRKGKIVVYDYGNEILEPWTPDAENLALSYLPGGSRA